MQPQTYSIFKSKRFYFVLAVTLISLSLLEMRLFQKQIIEHEDYKVKAAKQTAINEELPSSRGKIYISNYYGTDNYLPLATNLTLYKLLVVPKNLKSPKKVAEKLSLILDLDERELYSKINNKKPYIPPIQRKMSKELAQKIEKLNLDGVLLIPEKSRYYPEDNLASHVLGFVNAENKGQYGLEGYYDFQLKGKKGKFLGVKDTLGRYINISGIQKAEDGDDLYLSIDRNIQNYIEGKLKEATKKLKAKSGTVVVMDPATGAIMAMANYPDFNPNKFFEEENVNIYTNRAISDIYEPGSVFKPFVIAAALNEKKIDPDTTGTYGSSIRIGGYTISTATGKSYGKETISQILEHSDNVAMVHIGKKLGDKNLNKYLTLFGFGDRLGIDLAAETAPKIKEFSKWREINAATITFGQGIAITPLQLTNAMAAIANGGKLLLPYTVSKIKTSSGKVIETQPKVIREVVSSETADQVRKMLINVVEKGHGKAAKVPGFKVAGKTGTAQIPNPESSGYLEDQNIGSFCGFAPASDPAFVMLVKLDSPSGLPWAESSAAPLFGEIAEWLLSYLQVTPSD